MAASQCYLELEEVRTKPDGNCFFRCIALALCGTQDLHTKYRLQTAKFMASKDVQLQLEGFNTDGTWADAVRNCAKLREYVDHVVIHATAIMLSVKICIHHEYTSKATLLNEHASRVIHINYVNGNHYNLLLQRSMFVVVLPRKTDSVSST